MGSISDEMEGELIDIISELLFHGSYEHDTLVFVNDRKPPLNSVHSNLTVTCETETEDCPSSSDIILAHSLDRVLSRPVGVETVLTLPVFPSPRQPNIVRTIPTDGT